MKKIIRVTDLYNAQEDLRRLKEAYLRQHGWTTTCMTPGSFWLWRRDFKIEDERAVARWHDSIEKARADGRPMPSVPIPYGLIMAPLDLAVSMTEKVLAFAEGSPENTKDDE